MKAFEGSLKISYDLEDLFSNHTEIEFALFYPTELRDSVDKDGKANELCINGPLEIIDLDMENSKFVLRDKISNICITIDEKCIAGNMQIFLTTKDINYPIIKECVRLNEKLIPETYGRPLGYVWFRNGEDADWRIVYIKKAAPWCIVVQEIEYDSDDTPCVSSKSYNALPENLNVEIEFIKPVMNVSNNEKD